MQFAAQHREQGGLAAAVGADEAHALARVERHAGVVEQHLGAALEDKLVDSDHEEGRNVGNGGKRRKVARKSARCSRLGALAGIVAFPAGSARPDGGEA
ncbi:hypothetical protein GCM10027081_11750 [Cupriavidus yeoncheonensis]